MCYEKFWDNLKKDYGVTQEQLIKWVYAGFFPNELGSKTDKAKVYNGKRLWRDIMGDQPMPYEMVETQCVCDVEIIWNHILVEDPNAEEITIIILGSECIENYTDISKKRTCSICNVKCGSRLEIPLCKTCLKESKKKKCIKCFENIPKYSRGTHCSMKCRYPERCCGTLGCPNLKLGKWAATCVKCFYKNKANNYKKPP